MLKKLIHKVKNESDNIIEQGVEIGSEIFLDGILGQIVPGIVSFRMSHKQKQHEERIDIVVKEIIRRVDRLESKVEKLPNEEVYFVEEEVFPIIFDYAMEEAEKEKIRYIVNGFETIIENKITDQEIILSYFDVLKSLRLNEIDRLIEQTPEYRNRVYGSDKVTKLNIDLTAAGENKRAFTKYIDNKLEQLGLIETLSFIDVDVPVTPDDGPITKFGLNFIKFIRENG